jgi:putative ABC transport system permease protein
MSVFGREILFAYRSLRKSPAFTAAAVVTLALGLGSTTAIFSVVESVLLRPLPFPEPERIVVPESRKVGTGERWSITYADFVDWRDNHTFEYVAPYQDTEMDLTGPDEAVRVKAAAVGQQFFQVTGVRPSRGRLLQQFDYSPDAPRAVVISDRLWRTQFGRRSDIVGLTVEINAIKRPIVGVLPPDAGWPVGTDAWVPLRITSESDPDLQRRDNYVFGGLARLRPGVTLEGTRSAMAALAARASASEPLIRKDVTTQPTPVLEWMLGPTTPHALWMLLGAVTLLLLIACVNVANLQLARAAARKRELAVRSALGASRFRLLRHMLVESAVLAFVGGFAGVVLARWLVKLIVAAAPPDVPRIDAAAVSLPALAFGAAITMAVALLSGLVPALNAARSDPHRVVGEGGARMSTGRSSLQTRRTLVIVELALSVVLLLGAGLAIRSISHLRSVDPGFDPASVVTASISLPSARYDSDSKVVRLLYELQARLAAGPNVEAAAIASASPLGGGGFYLGRVMAAEGREPIPINEVPVNWNVTTPGYFAVLHVPLLRGRDFTSQDDSAAPPVMIVNETFAKAMFGRDNPIGRRAMSTRDEKVYREIIGVVHDVKYFGARDSTRALVWVPYAQNNAWHQGIITIRARGDALNAIPTLRGELHALDGGIALANVMTMNQAMARSMAGDRMIAVLLTAFATLALTLAAVGIFGILSYTVAQRTHELGIRMALGAQKRDVVQLVLRETLPMVTAGVLVGIVVGVGISRLLESMLYDVRATDPATIVGVALVLCGVGLTAAFLPARRAATVSPIVALRVE